MARFDVYANPEATEGGLTPYLVDVQNDYIDGLATRVVIPLRPARVFGARAERLHPLVKVRAEEMVLDTAAMGTLSPTARWTRSPGINSRNGMSRRWGGARRAGSRSCSTSFGPWRAKRTAASRLLRPSGRACRRLSAA